MVTKLFTVSLCRESRHISSCQKFLFIIMREGVSLYLFIYYSGTDGDLYVFYIIGQCVGLYFFIKRKRMEATMYPERSK
jgi:hypothetical protein